MCVKNSEMFPLTQPGTKVRARQEFIAVFLRRTIEDSIKPGIPHVTSIVLFVRLRKLPLA